jgi:YesN/AraC family two-component response regulator
LRQLGYRVLPAADGAEALRIWDAEGGRIDLLFTDMVMPGGISGLDLGLRLRRLKNDLNVLIVSGYSAELPYVEGPIGLSIEYLNKPYTLSRLSDVLRRVLGASNDPAAS